MNISFNLQRSPLEFEKSERFPEIKGYEPATLASRQQTLPNLMDQKNRYLNAHCQMRHILFCLNMVYHIVPHETYQD